MPVFLRQFVRYSLVAGSWIPIVFFVNQSVAELSRVNGPSMSPFFNERHNESTARDVCLNCKFDARNGLQRGMIVSFRCVASSISRWRTEDL